MKRKFLHGLIVLNLALLTAVAWFSFAPAPATGQGLAGRAGDYVMIGGRRDGVTPATIYVFDLNTGVILALEPRQRGRGGELIPTGFRVITNDFGDGGGR